METHAPDKLRTLTERFQPAHQIQQVDTAGKVGALPAWLTNLGPWMAMRPRGS